MENQLPMRNDWSRQSISAHAAWPTLLVCLGLVLPAFAGNSSYNLSRATTPYTHNRLPCSTVSPGVAPAAKTSTSLQQLDQVERQSLTVLKAAPARRNPPLYRPAPSKAEKPIPIEYGYQAPRTRR
jgi:hypothetical protein